MTDIRKAMLIPNKRRTIKDTILLSESQLMRFRSSAIYSYFAWRLSVIADSAENLFAKIFENKTNGDE